MAARAVTSDLATVSETPYNTLVSGFTKLFSTIVHSTIWREEMHVKVVWVTMLALADRNGLVPVSLPGLADAARVTLEQCEDAIQRLEAPDPYSRTKDHEGRRIEEVDGGWILLNYLKYRELRDADERRIKTREYVRQHRERKAKGLTVSTGKHIAEAEAEAEAENGTTHVGLPARRGATHVAIREHLAAVLASITEDRERRLTAEEQRRVMGELVFAYWQAKTGHTKALLDPKRETRLLRHLEANGDNVHELLYAIDGWFRDSTFRKLKEEGRTLDGIQNIFTDRERVERLAGHCPGYRDETPHPMAVKYLEPVL